ncbi:MAG: hypothetical protein H6765_00010 [Candidatus Peribacteria bacterium]|nr:MAG: hypothetical protein H6765_00010 [Candidatus Peribacteria bacterium]
MSKDRSGQIGRDAPLDFKEWVKAYLSDEQLKQKRPKKDSKPFTDKDLELFEASLIAGEVFFTTPDDAQDYLKNQ